jgi:hypothetical protein
MREAKDEIVIANEFAHVTVRKISSPDGDLVVISAPKRERVMSLDARLLWTLAGQPTQVFSDILAVAPIGFAEN